MHRPTHSTEKQRIEPVRQRRDAARHSSKHDSSSSSVAADVGGGSGVVVVVMAVQGSDVKCRVVSPPTSYTLPDPCGGQTYTRALVSE